MEMTILKFSNTHDADSALERALAAEGDRKPWLHDVAVVRRPLIGKISIRVTFEDGDKPIEIKRGDLASEGLDAGAMTGYLVGSLIGPLHADMAAMEGATRGRAAGKELGDKLMFVDEIKQVLPRGSSALVLVATPEVNDQLVQVFASDSPEIIRRDLAREVEQRLHTFEEKVRQSQAAQA